MVSHDARLREADRRGAVRMARGKALMEQLVEDVIGAAAYEELRDAHDKWVEEDLLPEDDDPDTDFIGEEWQNAQFEALAKHCDIEEDEARAILRTLCRVPHHELWGAF